LSKNAEEIGQHSNSGGF